MLEGAFLLLFDLPVPLVFVEQAPGRVEVGDHHVVEGVQLVHEICREGVKQQESLGELAGRVREVLRRVVRVEQVAEVHAGAEWPPHVSVELAVAALGFTGRQIVRRDQEDAVSVDLLEFEVQIRLHCAATAVEKALYTQTN